MATLHMPTAAEDGVPAESTLRDGTAREGSGRPGKTRLKPPCAHHPDDWDLDVGTPENWQEAVTLCHGCPLMTQCRDLAATLTARGMPPRSMIWAGVGYDSSGRPIEDLTRHRSGPIEYRRPLRIVHTGAAAAQARPAAEIPIQRRQRGSTTEFRRTIILRRRTISPGTSSTGLGPR